MTVGLSGDIADVVYVMRAQQVRLSMAINDHRQHFDGRAIAEATRLYTALDHCITALDD